eukprot:403369594
MRIEEEYNNPKKVDFNQTLTTFKDYLKENFNSFLDLSETHTLNIKRQLKTDCNNNNHMVYQMAEINNDFLQQQNILDSEETSTMQRILKQKVLNGNRICQIFQTLLNQDQINKTPQQIQINALKNLKQHKLISKCQEINKTSISDQSLAQNQERKTPNFLALNPKQNTPNKTFQQSYTQTAQFSKKQISSSDLPKQMKYVESLKEERKSDCDVTSLTEHFEFLKMQKQNQELNDIEEQRMNLHQAQIKQVNQLATFGGNFIQKDNQIRCDEGGFVQKLIKSSQTQTDFTFGDQNLKRPGDSQQLNKSTPEQLKKQREDNFDRYVENNDVVYELSANKMVKMGIWAQKGIFMIHFRGYQKDQSKHFPEKEGLALTGEQWRKFCKFYEQINADVQCIYDGLAVPSRGRY